MSNKSWLFWVITLAILALIFCASLLFLAPDTQVAANTMAETGDHLLKVLVKIVLIIIFTLIFSSLYFKFILHTPLVALRDKLRESNNDSHAYIIGGIIGSLVVVFTKAGGANLHQYLYQLGTRATAGYFVAIVITLAVTRVFGIRSVHEFRSYINRPNNDSYAILVLIILIASLFVAMS